MPIEFRCSQCGRLLRTGDDTAGRMAQCPECGAQTPVPELESQDIPSPEGGDPFDSHGQKTTDTPGYQNPYQAGSARAAGQSFPANPVYALKRVSAPAVCLILTAMLGMVLNAMGILGNALHLGVNAAGPWKDIPKEFIEGPVAITGAIIGLILSLVVLLGAIKMKGLENYGFAIVASILSIIPCTSPCCCFGLPFGIWALVVLSDPVVKASFKS